jgi:hypothetical protein
MQRSMPDGGPAAASLHQARPSPPTTFEARSVRRSRVAHALLACCFGGGVIAMKKVLMVVPLPPLAGSSGIQRTLRFAQQLPEFG